MHKGRYRATRGGVATAKPPAPYGFVRSRSAFHGPDPKRAADQLLLLQNWYKKWGPAEFDKRMVWILRKKPEQGEQDLLPQDNRFWNRKLVPFVHNRIQVDLDLKKTKRDILLKARQVGHTTYCLINGLFVPTILEPGSNAMLISQNNKYVTKHFAMLQRVYAHFGKVDPFDRSRNTFADELKKHLLHTVVSNRRELVFDMLDSTIMVESAEVPEAGQGVTITHLHCSEVARWPGNPEETMANVKESVVEGGTIVMESTADGMGNYFHQEWLRAEAGDSDFTAHFYPWFWHEEYVRDAVDPTTLSDEEKRVVRAYGLSLEQVGFRREKKRSLRHNFDEKYPEDSRSCFLSVSGTYFDAEVVKIRYLELQDRQYRPTGPGAFRTGVPWPDTYKKLEIYKNPVKHRDYIIGADVASGKPVAEGSTELDNHAAWVIDLETGELMARYRSKELPEDFAWDLNDLGRRYNNAQIAVERTSEGGTVILALQINCQYTNIYKHRDWWKRGQEWQKTKQIEGWPTTPKTRPVMLNRIRFFLMDTPELIYSVTFLEECLVFVRDKNGKPAAAPGGKDDEIFAAAIAHAVRQIRLGYLVPENMPKESYETADSEEEQKQPENQPT